MVGHRLLKYRLLMFLLCLLICSSLLSACGGNTFPTDQANACTTQAHARVQNFTKLPASSQTLYVSSGTNLYALDALNGATRWCDQIKSSGSPSYDNIQVLTLDQTNLYTYTEYGSNLVAFNPVDGRLRWVYNKGAEMVSPLDRVYTPAANQTVYDGLDTMYALNEQDGTIRWQETVGQNEDTFIDTVPVVNDGTVYVGVTDLHSPKMRDGIIALDAANGNQRWRIGWPEDDSYGGRSFVSGNLLVDQGKLFFSSFGQLDAVDARTGASIWQDQINPIDSPLFGANDVLYIMGAPNGNDSPTTLYAVDMRTGRVRWTRSRTDIYMLNGNTLYLLREDETNMSTTGYDLIAVNPQTGKDLWQLHCQLSQPEAGGAMKLVIMNDEIYVGMDRLDLCATNPHDCGVFIVHAFNMFNGVEDWSATVYGGVRGNTQDASFINMVGSQ